MLQYGYQCGMIWGAVLTAGRQAYLRYGATPQAETYAVGTAQRLVETFRSLNKHTNCFEITELDRSSSSMQMVIYFLLKGGFVGCCRRVAKYSSAALREIESSLLEESVAAPAQSVSCAAILARKMGVSEMHAMMAAGLAGGIGLSGGGCGALGAAIWIMGLEKDPDQSGKPDMNEPTLSNAVEKFLKFTGYKFECSEIAGRSFSSLDDHSSYLLEGGCSELIELLAGG